MGCKTSKIQDTKCETRRIDEILRQSEMKALKQHITGMGKLLQTYYPGHHF